MSAGVWYGKRTWLGLGFALVLALALDALGALLLARGMVPMAAARAWALGSWAAGGFCGTRMAVRAECGSLPVAAAVGLGLYGIVWTVGLAAWQTAGFRWDVTAAVFGGPLLAGLLRPGKAKNAAVHRGRGDRLTAPCVAVPCDNHENAAHDRKYLTHRRCAG